MGADSYAKKDYAAAAGHYSESLKYSPQNDSAYLYLGLSQWRQQQLDEAMARLPSRRIEQAEFCEGPGVPRADLQARNNNSLDGIDWCWIRQEGLKL